MNKRLIGVASDSITDGRGVVVAGTIVAAIATVGSLWFSTIWGLNPCDLCWYQRILMYPLVVVLGVAGIEKRPTVYRTALPLSIIGGGIAAYHSYLQWTIDQCTIGVGCAAVQWRLPGLGLTIPNLSLIAFVILIGLLSALAVHTETETR